VTIAVMQPYLFPYLGYIQLMRAVDTFVFFDDVNFINKGWINRNNILVNGNAHLFTLPLKKASQNKLINEIEISDYTNWKAQFLQQIEFNYKKAPHFETIFFWLKKTLETKQFTLLNELVCDTLKSIAGLLEFKTKFQHSSQINYKNGAEMNGQDKVLSICKSLNATNYINPKNGQELYNREDFTNQNIKLNFILMDDIQYMQNKNKPFVPFLSILDVLMYNGSEGTKLLLEKYQLN
jgi:hypothetical protein